VKCGGKREVCVRLSEEVLVRGLKVERQTQTQCGVCPVKQLLLFLTLFISMCYWIPRN